MAESLRYSLKTITTLLIGHTPVQDKKVFVFLKNNSIVFKLIAAVILFKASNQVLFLSAM